MSIIHEALKKTNPISNINIGNSNYPIPKNRNIKDNNIILMISIFLFLCILNATLYFIFPKIKSITIKSINPKSHNKKINLAYTKGKNKPYNRLTNRDNNSSIFLNGTVVVDGKRAALINNEIYKIGDIIDGKKIVNITLEGIELLDKDKIITIKQRR